MPSVMRYDRVQMILESEAALKDFLGPKDQEIVKRNKEKHYYSRGVVLVTKALHERGFDAHTALKPDILRLAVDLLRDKPQKQSAKNAEKTKPKTEAKPEVKPEQKPEAVEPKPKPEPKRQKEAAVKPPKPPKPTKAAVKPEPAPAPAAPVPATDQKPGYVYYAYGTALSLALLLHRTLEIGDRMPGAETRLEAVSKIIDMLKPMSSHGVPMPEEFDGALKHEAPSKG